MRQKNIKASIAYYVLVLLVCTLLISLLTTGSVYSKYLVSGDGSDSTQIAEFSFEDDLSSQAQNVSLSMSPGESVETSITVRNKGDVTLRYVVTVENLTGNLPIAEEKLVINSASVGIGETSAFKWKIEWPKEKNSAEYMGKMDVLHVVVTVEQVD